MPVMAIGGAGFLGDVVRQGMSALAEDVRGEIIPECGHWVADEQPGAFNNLLRDFLGGSA